MAYVDGFVLAVPDAKKEAYRKLAEDASVVFRRNGAIGFVDNWGDDVPQGKTNCFNSAVKKTDGETVVFSWINWQDQAAHDAGWGKIMAVARMAEHGPASVGADMGRMIYGTFKPIVVA